MKKEILALVEKVKNLIDKKVKDKSFQPEEDLYFRWELNDFSYGPNGVESTGAQGKTFTKRFWARASVDTREEIKKAPEYSIVANSIQKKFGEKYTSNQALDTFLSRVVWNIFEQKEGRASFSGSGLVKRFIRDLEGEPVTYTAKVQLQGVILDVDEVVVPEIGLRLRRPTQSDLEKEIPYLTAPLSGNNYHSNPSAIGEVSFVGRGGHELQLRIEKIISILRLFRVGSVKQTSYSTSSDSLIDITANGVMTLGNNFVAIESSHFNSGSAEKLKNFVRVLDPLLPPKFYRFGQGEVSHLTIAFDRYNDSLLRSSTAEERIANVIMGLEALLLEAEQELSYRLGLRIAKMLSCFGFDAKQVREAIKDAYSIRSTFAHGGHLSPKERRKFETKYGSLDDLLRTILDYIRMILVSMVIVQKNKEELIYLIDDAFIDKDANTQLTNTLSSVKEIVN